MIECLAEEDNDLTQTDEVETTKTVKKALTEEELKFQEVNGLMKKYDKAESRAKWLASPEYAQ
jgi:hypothetical protein